MRPGQPDLLARSFADFQARVEVVQRLIPCLINENYLNEYGYDYALDFGEHFFDNLKKPVFREWQDLMARMKAAKFGAIFFGMGLTQSQGRYKNIDNAISLTFELNSFTKYVIMPMRGALRRRLLTCPSGAAAPASSGNSPLK